MRDALTNTFAEQFWADANVVCLRSVNAAALSAVRYEIRGCSTCPMSTPPRDPALSPCDVQTFCSRMATMQTDEELSFGCGLGVRR